MPHHLQTEPNLYMLITFHNLSAAYTVDCYGAYIEVERENNGYDARWCGNRVSEVSRLQSLLHLNLTLHRPVGLSTHRPTQFLTTLLQSILLLFNDCSLSPCFQALLLFQFSLTSPLPSHMSRWWQCQWGGGGDGEGEVRTRQQMVKGREMSR